MARILAKALNCAGTPGPTPKPDTTCHVCLAIANVTSLDVVEMDAASQRGGEQEERVLAEMRYSPDTLVAPAWSRIGRDEHESHASEDVPERRVAS